MKAVVIDDYPGFAELLSAWIASLYPHWDVIPFQTWENGKNALQSEQVDIVIVDVMMPGVSAEDILNFLEMKQPQAVVIVMSGFSQAEAEIERLKQRYKQKIIFLKKPFSKEELIEAIEEALRPA